MNVTESENIEGKQLMQNSEEACRNVSDLYNSGNNCDKAVFLALQDISLLPKEIWDFTDLYSDKPDDTEQFLCKVLAAGAIAIYLDILTRRFHELGIVTARGPEPIERVNELMTAILAETAAGRHDKLTAFDPFEQDTYLEKEIVTEEMRREYRQKATRLFEDFQQTFNCRDCVDILGFDPFSYELYDEEIQEQIESGEWMGKCVDCMQHIIMALIVENGTSLSI
jgi:hypothetical protein